MPTPIRLAVGIQARSTSVRLPAKVHQKLGVNTLSESVYKTAMAACLEIPCGTGVYMLIPRGDTGIKPTSPVIEGDEHDVLSRYVTLQEKTEADYIVRLTADCPLIPASIISAMAKTAIENAYDYISNVDESCRTSPDGWDCEVLSKHMLRWLDAAALTVTQREHVTELARVSPPRWAKRAIALSALPLQSMKLSVDTELDLARVRASYAELEHRRGVAQRIYGEWNVFTL